MFHLLREHGRTKGSSVWYVLFFLYVCVLSHHVFTRCDIGHIFCLACLVKCTARANSTKISCPMCARDVDLLNCSEYPAMLWHLRSVRSLTALAAYPALRKIYLQEERRPADPHGVTPAQLMLMARELSADQKVHRGLKSEVVRLRAVEFEYMALRDAQKRLQDAYAELQTVNYVLQARLRVHWRAFLGPTAALQHVARVMQQGRFIIPPTPLLAADRQRTWVGGQGEEGRLGKRRRVE